VLKEYIFSNGIPSEKIYLTKDVENTTDETVAVNELLSTSKRIILVTSAYHMYRAKRLFEKQGIEVISYKVGRNKEIVIMDFLPITESIKLTETGIREIIGRLFYLIKN
jgi:uncharacterized SAM-binding protein YcdF (DUF218 family)